MNRYHVITICLTLGALVYIGSVAYVAVHFVLKFW